MQKPVVLVVEDEALIRMNAVLIVEEGGFKAVEARNSAEAIWTLENRPDVRAVFTDIKMPGAVDGLHLAQAIRGRWPRIHLIVTSGLNVPARVKLPEDVPFIRKPYHPDQLLASLRGLFDPSPIAPFRLGQTV
jgi:CheY-like chemotaxis protein